MSDVSGIIKVYDNTGVLQDQGVYRSSDARTKFMELWREKIPGGYFDISIRGNRWFQSEVIPDFHKPKMPRPPAIYQNKNWGQ